MLRWKFGVARVAQNLAVGNHASGIGVVDFDLPA